MAENTTHPTLAVYIHWPFCKKKCPYCDFNSHVTNHIDLTAWHLAYIKELKYYATRVGAKTSVSSIFFGGGTPSLMPAALVATLIQTVADLFGLTADCEITLEANPTSAEALKFKAFKDAGVNRLSLGVQSLFGDDLAFLGREHSAREALDAVEMAANIFARTSFDMIYARPQQTLATWEAELKQALTHAGEHLSLYQLTVEKGTPFYAQHKDGQFALPEEDNAADMYELTHQIMADAGYNHYEISNFAKKGAECRHNVNIWRYGAYIGIGPGAHGRIIDATHTTPHRIATTTHHAPEKWLTHACEKGHGIMREGNVQNRALTEEALLMGLRLREGVPLSRLHALSGPQHSTLSHIDELASAKLIHMDENNTHITATQSGMLVLNSLVEKLLS